MLEKKNKTERYGYLLKTGMLQVEILDGLQVLQEEVKSLLVRVKKESESASLKLYTKKTKIMASGPITSWQLEGEKVDLVTDFLFLGSKITADGDCRHEIRRRLLLGRKAMTNPDNVMKNRDITLLTKAIQPRLWSSQWPCTVVMAGP